MQRLSTRRPVNSQRGWQWATTVAALAGGAATLTATSFRLACDEGSNSRLGPAEWGKANLNQTWNKIKTTITPSLASVMQQQLEEWNKSFDELVLLAQRLYSELSFAEESLARHIVDHDRKDVQLHPEIEWDAHVRIGDQPCFQERAYVRTRQRRIRESFARLLEIDNAEDIDPRDLPIFGVAASGGGYRALVNTTGSLSAMQNTGLLDFTHYVAGISGSCWSLSVLYSLAGGHSTFLREHVKSRISKDFLHPDTLQLLTEDPPARYLLSGMLIKQAVGQLDLADIYGTLVCSRVLLPDEHHSLSSKHLRLSSQAELLQKASLPLPIYSMVRHDVTEVEQAIKDNAKKNPLHIKEGAEKEVQEKKDLMSAAAWQWFELTPYEFGSPDFDAWIPCWALGRTFEGGKSQEPQPELSMTVMNGIFASAFSATLFHYWNEIKPLVKSINLLPNLEPFIKENQTTLSAIHPFPPTDLPNYVKGVKGLSRKAPINVSELDSLGFMDAGAFLNLPYLPLLRRGCDVILALDASADSQELWFKRAEEYANRLNLKRWPKVEYTSLFKAAMPEQSDEPLGEAQRQQGKARDQPTQLKQDESLPSPQRDEPDRLQHFNVWVGDSTLGSESARVSPNDLLGLEKVTAQRDGIALVYMPLLSKEVMETWSTWRFEYPPEETEKLLKMAESSIERGEAQLKAILKGIYQRKKARRLDLEADA